MEDPGDPVFSRGPHTLAVPMKLHVLNRECLVERLQALSDNIPEESVVVLQGGGEVLRGSTDTEESFRQESYFHWAFGVEEPGYYGAIDVATGKSVLFTPKLPESFVIWMGKIHSLNWFKGRYAVEEVYYTDDIAQVLMDMHPKVLLTLRGTNSDSGNVTSEAVFDGIEKFKIDNTVLFNEINECRVIKTPLELEVIRYAYAISSAAHKEVMLKIRPGMMEYQVHCIFQYHCAYYGGAQFMAYKCICATGRNSAVLHYGHDGNANNKIVQDGDMCMFDLGAEYYCYTSDITCSFPANGKFTEDQRAIYEAVLNARGSVLDKMRPGTEWLKMHELAESMIIQALRKLEILAGDVEEMIKANMAAIFMPHGLGHLVGCDVHDVGGYPPSAPPRSTRFGAKSLRTTRRLQEGMVITVEPGIYFIEPLLNKALQDPNQSQFINTNILDRFRDFGGVRIEDGVLVKQNGIELLSNLPRTVQEIEKFMSGQ